MTVRLGRNQAFGFLLFMVTSFTFLFSRYLFRVVDLATPPLAAQRQLSVNIHNNLDLSARPDVPTITHWNAPILWEGMFHPQAYDQMHLKMNTSVALTVFAVGRYLDVYLKDFLISAEQHFMLGLSVKYYVFTDAPKKMPKVELGPGRALVVYEIEKHTRWQDISMMRMKIISDVIDSQLRYSFRYVFSFDVDQVFRGRFGSEALGDSVVQLHAHFYNLPKDRFTYERNNKSKAYLEEGDFYYHASIFGGYWEEVKNLADACYDNIMEDKLNGIEALWHDESHLNKYFWLNKPSRLLSPEYCWDTTLPDEDIRIKRVLWADKYYEELRGI